MHLENCDWREAGQIRLLEIVEFCGWSLVEWKSQRQEVPTSTNRGIFPSLGRQETDRSTSIELVHVFSPNMHVALRSRYGSIEWQRTSKHEKFR